MLINSVDIKTNNNRSFGHSSPWSDSPYKRNEQVLVGLTTAAGTLSGMALLAKYEGYSLNPKRMFKNIKNSFWAKREFETLPVLSLGAGSCLGGLAGGYMIDKNKENRKAKKREALLQMTNISLPIIFTSFFANVGKKLGNKYWDKSRPNNLQTFRTKLPQGVLAITGLILGVFTANVVGNKINEHIYHQGKGRPVQATDFSAHLDDICMAAQKISSADIVRWITRIVPFALMIAGNEVGNTTVENADS